MLISVAMTSALCHPKVSFFVGFLMLILRARIDIINPNKSVAKCAQSVKIAIELEM